MERVERQETENRYSLWVGLVFIFNIIVGTGALTLPAALAKAGWALGTISILFLAFVSFITATYIIECMSCANAVLRWRNIDDASQNPSIQQDVETDESANEITPMHRGGGHRSENIADDQERLAPYVMSPGYYGLDVRVELGEMATMFFTRLGRMVFYATMIVYLFGDLSIYSAAVAKSAMDVICTYVPDNFTESGLSDAVACFNETGDGAAFTRLECYRTALVTFMFALGPFVFFNVQKTKYLQIFTTVMRWLAFMTMIALAVRILSTEGAKGNPPAFDMRGIPALFGACVYSFMCHHSLPGMIAPIKTKKSLGAYMSLDFLLIALFYLLLALTGVYAFANLEDLYTLNFIPSASEDQSVFLKVVDYFLALFPVLTLSASFPVIAITLRNNIQCMFLDMSRLNSYNLVLRRLLFPVVTVLPPILITLFMEDITSLVSYTGSYAGAGVQYLIPTFLVLAARKQCGEMFGIGTRNPYESPFRHTFWAIFVIIWSFVCVILVSLHFLENM